MMPSAKMHLTWVAGALPLLFAAHSVAAAGYEITLVTGEQRDPFYVTMADGAKAKAVGACHFARFYDAMDAARHLVTLDPTAVELVDREAAEIVVIEAYLPQMLSGDELMAKVREVAEAIGFAGPQDKGRFMKEWMSRHKGLAEGRDVQAALGQL